jgi:hypothetical protein
MYRCPSCQLAVPWWHAAGATPAVPFACSACGKESHQRYAYAFFWLALALVAVFSVLSLLGVAPAVAGWLLATICAALLVAFVFLGYKSSSLVATVQAQKRRARLSTLALLLTAVVGAGVLLLW